MKKNSRSNAEIKKAEHKATLEKLTKQVAKGGGIAFTGQIIGKFVRLVFQVMLSRVLGEVAYGLYALGLSVLEILRVFAMQGLHSGIVRFGSIYRGESDKPRLKGALWLAFGIVTASSLAFSICLFLLAGLVSNRFFQEPDLTIVIQVFAVSLPFFTLMTVAAHAARIFRKMEYYVGVTELFRPITNLAIVGTAFLLGYKLLESALYGFLISSVLAAFLGLYFVWRQFPQLFSKLKPLFEMKKILFYSLTVFLAGFSHLLLMKTDRIMIGIFGAARDVGIYNAAAVMAAQVAFFLGAFNAIFPPIIADLHNRGMRKQMDYLLKLTGKWIFGLTFPVFLVIVIFSKPLMGLFGKGFVLGWPVLIVLAGAQMINAGVGPVGFMLTMTGRQKLELLNSLVLGVLNVILNIILILKFGVLGAAIATGISLGVVNLARLIEVYFIYRMHPYKLSYWRPIVAGLVATVACLGWEKWLKLGDWQWVLNIFFFGIVYLVVVAFFKLDEEDIIVIQAFKKRFHWREGKS
jgi:O-antigen/teichoic acid export membrane protein